MGGKNHLSAYTRMDCGWQNRERAVGAGFRDRARVIVKVKVTARDRVPVPVRSPSTSPIQSRLTVRFRVGIGVRARSAASPIVELRGRAVTGESPGYSYRNSALVGVGHGEWSGVEPTEF